jgi:transcriptional/translational regulatory protein YebC/TACO1
LNRQQQYAKTYSASSKPPQKQISPNSSRLPTVVRDFHQRTLERNPAQIQWQKAVDTINTQDPATIQQRKANISKLIATLNEDDDIEEQQQAVATIRSLAEPLETRFERVSI